MLLLSRVAESVYWTGRHLERAEASARLVRVHTDLYCDLPLSAGITWSPLLLVTGNAPEAGAREDEVVELLAADPDNPSSTIASLHAARMNLRITRDQFPPAVWEELNDLYLWADDHVEDAVDRRTRSRWTTEVVRRCQLLSGLLLDAMRHDEVHSFLEIGRFVERADMTTRVLDVQSGVLLDSAERPYVEVTWKSVLESLAARHAFHRATRTGISGPDILRFLLRDAQFPRSIEHCVTRIARALLELPAHEEPMAGCAEVQQTLEDTDVAALGPAELHDFVDDVQVLIGALHDLLGTAYFETDAPATAETLALLA